MAKSKKKQTKISGGKKGRGRSQKSLKPEVIESRQHLPPHHVLNEEAPNERHRNAEFDGDADFDLDSDERIDPIVAPADDEGSLAGDLEPTQSSFLPNDEPASKALAPTDPVARYMMEIRKYPLLSKDEEKRIAHQYYESKDPSLAEILVTSNLRFVVKVAAEYSKFGARLIDLIQEGNIGLMHAVKEFNPYKDVRLITYAIWWIRGYIQDYLMRQYSMVRIGTTQNQRKLYYQLQKHKQDLERLGYQEGIAQLSGRLDIPEQEVEKMAQRMSGRDVSLDQPIDVDQKSTLIDLQKAEDAIHVDEAIGHLEELQLLKQNIEDMKPHLNERETFLLENRLLSDQPMTLQEIGDHYGITREAVRQMEARLINKIKATMTS